MKPLFEKLLSWLTRNPGVTHPLGIPNYSLMKTFEEATVGLDEETSKIFINILQTARGDKDLNKMILDLVGLNNDERLKAISNLCVFLESQKAQSMFIRSYFVVL